MKRKSFIWLMVAMVLVGTAMVVWQVYNCWWVIEMHYHAPHHVMQAMPPHAAQAPHPMVPPAFVLHPALIAVPSVVLILAVLAIFWIALHTIIRQKSLDQMKNDFINNMTHEFKTPLASITLAGEMLQDPAFKHSPEADQRVYGVITNEARRLSMLVERVLQLSVFDSKHSNMHKSELDLHQMIRDVQEQFALRTTEREGVLNIDLHATAYQVWGDETHISNVLYNLLDNALKYTLDTPHILIRTWNDEEHNLLIAIKDNGIGMKEEDQKHVFERFYRASTGNVHSVKGFGLGLAYVKTIVEAHRGQITLKSEPGKGSTFTIQLPTYGRQETNSPL